MCVGQQREAAALLPGNSRVDPEIGDLFRSPGGGAEAIAWQAAAWPADLIVLTRPPRLAITRLVGGSVPDQVMRKASCPVLAVPPRQSDRQNPKT